MTFWGFGRVLKVFYRVCCCFLDDAWSCLALLRWAFYIGRNFCSRRDELAGSV